MLLEQLIMEQLIVLKVFGLASDTDTYMEQFIVGQLIEAGGFMLPEELIVEVLGPASDTGTYMKEKQDKIDLSTPKDRPRTFRSQADHGTVDRVSSDRGRIDVAGTADRGSARTSQ
jgi:hypothetical protein